jgi:deazaflavin-dependent oxidoreductase (nitroreductase family)
VPSLPDDMLAYNRNLIESFRRDGAPAGRPLLLLTTKGRRSGERHTAPTMYIPDGERLLVIGSNAGSPRHPAWYLNLVADPHVTVEVGVETYEAIATPLPDEERAVTFASIAERFPFFAEHQATLERTIPVVALERIRD